MRIPAAASIFVGVLLSFLSGSMSFAGDLREAMEIYERGDYDAAFRQFKRLAESGAYLAEGGPGNPGAMHIVAGMYECGIGVRPDDAEAERWGHLSAEAGIPRGGVNGYNPAFKRHYLKDYSKAVDWLPSALLKWCRGRAEQGNARAQYSLGRLFHRGVSRRMPTRSIRTKVVRCLEPDIVQSYRWLQIAVDQSGSDSVLRKKAVDYRDLIAPEMTPAQIAEAQKMAREWKPKKEKCRNASGADCSGRRKPPF